MPRPSAREKVLDAYQDILLEYGPSAVTLEAVAARAGVSKGGLLYHFQAKDALLDGLLERVLNLNDADLEAAKQAAQGPIRYYLRTSITDVTEDAGMHRTSLAAIRMMLDDPRVAQVLRRCFDSWRSLLRKEIDDPLTAELVAVVGDGLYLRAALGEPSEQLSANLDAVLVRLGATP